MEKWVESAIGCLEFEKDIDNFSPLTNVVPCGDALISQVLNKNLKAVIAFSICDATEKEFNSIINNEVLKTALLRSDRGFDGIAVLQQAAYYLVSNGCLKNLPRFEKWVKFIYASHCVEMAKSFLFKSLSDNGGSNKMIVFCGKSKLEEKVEWVDYFSSEGVRFDTGELTGSDEELGRIVRYLSLISKNPVEAIGALIESTLKDKNDGINERLMNALVSTGNINLVMFGINNLGSDYFKVGGSLISDHNEIMKISGLIFALYAFKNDKELLNKCISIFVQGFLNNSDKNIKHVIGFMAHMLIDKSGNFPEKNISYWARNTGADVSVEFITKATQLFKNELEDCVLKKSVKSAGKQKSAISL